MSPTQVELDSFENAILVAVFGQDYQNNNTFRMLNTWMPGKVQSYIDRFETIITPFMNPDGSTDGTRLRDAVALKYPELVQLIPNGTFHLSGIADAVSSFVRGMK